MLAPMLATAGPLPTPAEEDRWALELKWDGIRAMVYVQDGSHRIVSRNGRDVTAVYPELTVLACLDTGPLVVDGEIVALDSAGKPDFGLLQRRMNLASAAQVQRVRTEVPVTFLAFDLLWTPAGSILQRPYDERRTLLEALPLHTGCTTVPPALGVPADLAVDITKAQGLEGLVAKRRDSAYVPGKRSDCWRKIKHFATTDVVVGGWTEGLGGRRHSFGALVVGVPVADGLRFVGQVGTGFTQQTLETVLNALMPLEVAASPFNDVVPPAAGRRTRWVRPVLVGEIAYANVTRDGRLRHPAWRGLRPDRSVDDVRGPA